MSEVSCQLLQSATYLGRAVVGTVYMMLKASIKNSKSEHRPPSKNEKDKYSAI